jgi:hypothetical protein
MFTRLLSLALFVATLYYLPRHQRPTPPRKVDVQQLYPPGHDFQQVWLYAPAADGTLRKVG